MTQFGGRGPAPGRGGNDKVLLNDPRYLESMMSQSQMPNVAKELVHPGKSGDPLELLMRCNIKDEKQLNAIVQYFGLCDEFDLREEKKMLAYRLAGSVSIDGIARRELVMAATNIIAPSLYEVGTNKKQRDGNKKRDEGKDNKEEER
jgi:hypothetical protein